MTTTMTTAMSTALVVHNLGEIPRRNIENLAREYGCEDRVVFIDNIHDDDLKFFQRLSVKDLFIDLWPYNAHTIASMALFTGLPLMTVPGDAMASHVAALRQVNERT